MNTFCKLRDGSWGVRVEGAPVQAGDNVVVTKKGGGTDTVTISKVVWSGNGVTLCALPPKAAAASSRGGRTNSSRCHCGQQKNPRFSSCRDCYVVECEDMGDYSHSY